MLGAASLPGPTLNGVAFILDMTDSKKAEEEKKKLEAKLLQAQKLESVGILAGGIAHDFNNLLSVITGNLSMAKDELTPGDSVFELLDETEKASSRAKELTSQIITFSKGGAPVKKTGLQRWTDSERKPRKTS